MRRSIGDPGDGAQFVRRCRTEAEELKIGRDLLEKHVGANLKLAAALARCGEERSDPGFATSPAKADGSMRDRSTGSGSPSFMPSGVALTTRSYPAGSFEPVLTERPG